MDRCQGSLRPSAAHHGQKAAGPLSVTLLGLGLITLSGCGSWPRAAGLFDGFMWVQMPPKDNQLVASFQQTVLGQSTSGQVLAAIHKPRYEMLSQSESVVASYGQKKQGRKVWLNMVVFDEQQLTARRKYFLVADEKPPYWLWRQKCRIDIEQIADEQLLEKPYANENARRIAVLRQILADFNEDVRQVREDSRTLDVCAMMLNQTLRSILQRLDDSPVLAGNLSEPEGLPFDHPILGRAAVRMVLRDHLVKVKVKIGSIAGLFARQADVKDM